MANSTSADSTAKQAFASLHSARGLNFENVILVPKECTVVSRSEIDVSVKLGNQKFTGPFIPANMSSVVDEKTVRALTDLDLFYVMHRFDVDILEFIKTMKAENRIASISLGVQKRDFELVGQMANQKIVPDFITIDVAHGDTATVRSLISTIKNTFGDQVFVIAGNIATPEAAVRLADAGANAVKVGVAPGAACLTGPNTGFGSRGWQLTAIQEVKAGLLDAGFDFVDLIADGGIRLPGDIAKALAFGASMVMVGSMFAGHDESPGTIITAADGTQVKEYYGSASAQQKGNNKNVEGLSMTVPYRGPLSDTVEALIGHLQSSVSYAGGNTLEALKSVSYVIV